MITTLLLAAAVAVAPAGKADDVRAAFENVPAHPRLHVRGPEALAAFREPARMSPERRALRTCVVDCARDFLTKPRVKPRRVGRRLDEGQAPEIVRISAAAYGFTGERRFAERAKAEMLSMCDWPEWIPEHYLGTAEVLGALAFGYDWTYDALSDEERTRLRTAMIERGYGGMTTNCWWRKTDNNWGQVCWQGVTAAAIAICEDDRARSERLLAEAIPALRRTARAYAPNGAYPEGPGYWSYGTGRFVQAIDQFEKAFGTSFGLFDLPGVARTGEYKEASFGTSGRAFNYSDCGSSSRTFSPTVAFFRRRAGLPVVYGKLADIKPMNALWALLLLDDDAPAAAEQPAVLDYFGGGRNDVAMFRSSAGADAFWLGVKGGSVSCNHGHMDVGSFVLDAKRERWAHDLGSQNYHSIERLGTIRLWDMRQQSTRWTIFRQSPLSHNLVTIDGRRLVVKADARIVPVRVGDVTEVTLDLAPVYGAGVVKGARRTFVFDRPSGKVTVRDAFAGLKPGSRLRWQLVTKASCAIDGRAVTLSQHGKSIVLADRLRAAWRVIDISQGPNPWDCGNPGFSELTSEVEAPASGAVDFEVEFLLGRGD